MLQTFSINRLTGELSRQTDDKHDGYIAACVNAPPKGVALNTMDFNEKSNSVDDLVDVLKTKVERVTAAQNGGVKGAQFQALVRDVQILAGRIMNASAVE
jgi:hypothetical protein